MSRRTRLRSSKQSSQLGLNHHSQYSSSQTYFPESYSIFGTPISMPAKMLPLEQDNKINCVLSQKQLLSNECPLLGLSDISYHSAKLANITIAGTIIQDSNRIITNCVFIISMAFCCLLSIFSNSMFRRKFYTRYEMETREYQRLGQLIRKLSNCQNLIINIQDNKLNQPKMDILQSAICQSIKSGSLENDYELGKSRKTVTIRNYCYFMKDISLSNVIQTLSQIEQIDTVFIWQKNIIHSSSKPRRKGEAQSLLGPILNC